MEGVKTKQEAGEKAEVMCVVKSNSCALKYTEDTVRNVRTQAKQVIDINTSMVIQTAWLWLGMRGSNTLRTGVRIWLLSKRRE